MKKNGKTDRLLPALLYLFRLNRVYFPLLLAMLSALVVNAAGEVGMGWVFAHMVDTMTAQDGLAFGRYVLVLLALLIGGLAAAAISRLTGGKYANICRWHMRRIMGEKLVRVPIAYLEKRRSGDLLSMLGNDLVQIGDFFENQFRMLVGEWVRFAFSLAYMIVLNPWLTLITVAFIPIGGLLTTLASKPVQRLSAQQNAALGGVISLVQDSVSGQSEVKAFAMYQWIGERFTAALHRWLRLALRTCSAQVRTDAVGIVNLLIPFGALMIAGLWLALHGQITAGGMLAFIYVSNGIVNPIMALNWRIGELRRASGAANRLMVLMETEEERADGRDLTIQKEEPLLRFEGVDFSYLREGAERSEERQRVLAGLSLELRHGETVAVVGQSGSGKSTLLKLAAGFYEPDKGQVCFGGYPLQEWNLGALRARLSMVDQDTYLFPGSIRENIACAAPLGQAAPSSEVDRAAQTARLWDFIQSLPDGLDTKVGERGARLSGGQRQRVAIARAALSGADLLLLDEPTSALDSATEKEIQKELEVLMEGRTALIVTHRLSLAAMADRIVVLDGGKIVEEGTHSQLMEHRGRYFALYQQQADQGGGGEAA